MSEMDDIPDCLTITCSDCGKKYYNSAIYNEVKECEDGKARCRMCLRKEQEDKGITIVIPSCDKCPMHTWRVVPDYGDMHGCGVTGYESWYTEFVFEQCPFKKG